MGNMLNSLRKTKKSVQLLVVGLDDAGKTTILNFLRKNFDEQTVPTVGFNVEKLTHKNLTINVWDVGGQETIRSLWQHYYVGTDALVFVIDSSNRDRIEDSKLELHKTIADPALENVSFLIFGNKSDCEGAYNSAELTEVLGLESLPVPKSKWIVMSSCAKSGEGLSAGLDWIISQCAPETQKKGKK